MTNDTLTLACPRCRNLTTWTQNPHRPFCSERCRLIDLGAWINEDYQIAQSDEEFETCPR